MSHLWCWLGAEHLEEHQGRPHAASLWSLVWGLRTVMLSDSSREWRGASVDQCSHNRGGETQLGHKYVCTARFEQHAFSKAADIELFPQPLPKHTHTPKKHKDSVFLLIFLFFWLVRCLKQDSDRRRCSWIYPWKSCAFYVKLQWERRVEGRGDEGGGEEKRGEGEEIRWEERRGDKVADPLCSSQSFKSSLKRDWVVAKNLARHTHTCTHHISCINSHTQTWKDTNIIVRPLTLDTLNNEGSAAFIWQRISSLHHLIMAALNHTNTHLHTVLVVLDTVC